MGREKASGRGEEERDERGGEAGAKARDYRQEINPGLPLGRQKPRYLSQHCPLPESALAGS